MNNSERRRIYIIQQYDSTSKEQNSETENKQKFNTLVSA